MKRIIYTCDRCGAEISGDRYHITITRETADEPELIGESCYQDYCLECMTAAMVYLQIAEIEEEQVAPEETIDLSAKTDNKIDPEDTEEPEESVLCELKAMDEKPSGRLTPEQKNQILDMYRHGKKYKQIAEIVGTDINKVRSAIHYARTKGII